MRLENVDTDKSYDENLITRKLVIEEDKSDRLIDLKEKHLDALGLHLDTKFEGDDSHFIIGFESELQLELFEMGISSDNTQEYRGGINHD